LLTQWNKRINLTGFDLEKASDLAIDRLICEPLASAHYLPAKAGSWIDIGSGGGSPAVPIKVVRPALALTMVEMRLRKAAFLREVARELGLVEAHVEDIPFQELSRQSSLKRSVVFITIRAVRADSSVRDGAMEVLRADGKVFFFGSIREQDWPGFSTEKTTLLSGAEHPSALAILTLDPPDVPRGTPVENR
jgi:16S rRNA (guanine527-N7)-methyltransferase